MSLMNWLHWALLSAVFAGLTAVFQVVVGGVLVFLAGWLIGAG